MREWRWAILMMAGLAVPAAGAGQTHGFEPRDLGVGIVSFESSPLGEAALPWTDTMVIRANPSADAPVVARFLFQVPEPYTWGYALEAREVGVDTYGLEFDYEVQGLAADSVTGMWVRVLYGLHADGSPRRGWAPLEDGRTRFRLWREILLERPLFFRDEADLAFHDRPGGHRIAVELARRAPDPSSAFDYRLEPLAVDGRWMKARLVTPDGSCDPDVGPEREHIVWIEYLDAEARPRVWYYTRGC
jgi:hypothetical protein